MIYISNELSHHGVKGMKWGVRKAEQNRKANRLLKELKKEESEELARYEKSTEGWSSAQKSVYNMTGRKVDKSKIKESKNKTIVDMDNYYLIFHKDGSTETRPKKK